MPGFKIVNDAIEVNLEWKLASKFNSKDRYVDEHGKATDFQGRVYQIIDKRVHVLTAAERSKRRNLGIALVICTLFFALLFKRARELFSKTADKPVRYAVALDPVEAKILKDFTPQMVKALGGIKKVMSIPIIENWNGEITVDDLKAPVMIGSHRDGTPFLLFCYTTSKSRAPTGEYLGRKEGGWGGAYCYPSELNLRSPNVIKDGTLEEKFMLDRITRLMNKRAMGTLERYEGSLASKPSKDKNSFRPNNAYLEGDELDAYMDLDTLFYEIKPSEGKTCILLHNPQAK